MHTLIRRADTKYLLAALLFVGAIAVPLLQNIQKAKAVSFTNRSLSLSRNTNAAGTATTTYSFSVTVPTGGNTGLRSVEVNFCTTPLGSCTAPTGMSVTSSSIGTTSPAGGGTLTSSNSGTPNSALASSGTSAQVRFQWASNQTLTLPQTVTFAFDNIQNPTSTGTFFARIGFFGNGDTTYTTVTDSGTVAQSVQSPTNVSFKVQEILQVCAGGTTVDATGTAMGTGDTCNNSGITGYLSAVDMGVADPAAVRVTPVASGGTTQGNATNGFVMVRTNAVNGTTIQYRTVPDSTGTANGELKVAGATCNANPSTSSTDQCINSVAQTQTASAVSTVTAGTEHFGMAAFGVNRTSGSTTAVTVNSNYDGDGASGGTCVPGTGAFCWTWQYDGNATTIASASGPIDDEAVLLKFAAASAFSTPSGFYQTNMDIFAVPTY